MSAYRDDLEAALQRAADLQSEVDTLRERNGRIEAQLASGEVSPNQTDLVAHRAREREMATPRKGYPRASRRERFIVSLLAGFGGAIGAGNLLTRHHIGAALWMIFVTGAFSTALLWKDRDDKNRRTP